MSIFIEGTDNSGKTTLANRLAKDLGFEVIHSPGPLDKGVEMITWLFKELISQKPHVIYDRISMISDPVYSPIIRKEKSFYSKGGNLPVMHNLLSLTPHFIIFCSPPIASIKAFGDRDQMDGVIDNTDELIMSYNFTMLSYLTDKRFNTEVYDFTEGEEQYERILDLCKKYIERKGEWNYGNGTTNKSGF